MPDREKVIKGLEICRHRVISQENCKECPYIYDGRAKQSNCEGVLHWDALELLKEQEKPNGKCVNECECWDSAYERGKQDALKGQEAKWVEDKQDEHCRLIKCSNCGLTFIVGNNIPYDKWIEDRNYCLRCGARMKGDRRNEQ